MRADQARRLFRALTKSYFAGANVVFANQSRTPMQNVPLVVLTPGNVHRPSSPNYEVIDGEMVGSYLSRLSFTIDLFTNGAPVKDPETGDVVSYEDNSDEDMLAFADFLNSEYTVEWSREQDVAVLIGGDVLNLSAVVNDTSYQYRSRLTVQFYFTQRAVGHAAVMSESSIQYPTGEIDLETGEPVYTPTAPEVTESTTGIIRNPDAPSFPSGVPEDGGVVIRPEFTPTNSGGGTQELADESTGFFTEAEVKEDTT